MIKTIICKAEGYGYSQPLMVNVISGKDDPIIKEAGFGDESAVLVTPLGSGVRPTVYDSYHWLAEKVSIPPLFPDAAMKVVHDWIAANVDDLQNDQVIPFDLDGSQWVVTEGKEARFLAI